MKSMSKRTMSYVDRLVEKGEDQRERRDQLSNRRMNRVNMRFDVCLYVMLHAEIACGCLMWWLFS